MKIIWKIILIVFVCLIGLALVYFYRLGSKKDTGNVTIVRRIVDPSKNSQAADETQIDQLLTNLTADLSTLQNSKNSPYLNEIITDLKGF